jgi:cytohesin
VDAKLEQAAGVYQTDELKALVRAAIPVQSRDARGRTPLHLVASLPFLKEELRLLLDRKADPNATDNDGMTPLHFAAADANASFSRALIAAGARANATDSRGRTPLHLVPFLNDVYSLTALLIEHGANPGLQDRLGRTALHAISDAERQNRTVAEILVCHGANPQTRDLLGWTAADLAAIRGWSDASPTSCGTTWQLKFQPPSDALLY